MAGEWLTFLVASLFVVGAGLAIGRISGEVGERLGLGRAWSGAVLLSFATTLPELVTTLTVARHGQYGMAVGNILGSILFNLFILVVVDLADEEPFYHRLSFNHVATGLLGAVLLGIMMVALTLGLARGQGLGDFKMVPPWAPSAALLACYGAGQYVLFRISQGAVPSEREVRTVFDRAPLPWLIVFYFATAAVIFFAARQLAVSAERLADHYRLSATFAGATLLGVITSLPEITNGIACARRKDFDLAMGNVLGANALVIAVLAVADLTTGARIFTHLAASSSLSGLCMAALGIIMGGVALSSLALRSRHKKWRVSVTSFLLAILFGFSLLIAYRFGL